MSSPKKGTALAKDVRCEPNEKEKIRMAYARERWIERTPPVEVDVKIDDAGKMHTVSPHSDDSGHVMRLGDTLGSRSPAFMSVALGQLRAGASVRGSQSPSVTEINAALAFVAAIAPQDELEAALAIQMSQNHALSTELMGMARSTENIDSLERYANLSVKLQRTFTAQVEALARMRGKGQQTVRVEHVTVQAGAQAIVGDVHHHPGGPGEHRKSEVRPYETSAAGTVAPSTALPSPNPLRDVVPLTSDAERTVPAPRRAKPRREPRE